MINRPPAYLSNPDAAQRSTDDAQRWTYVEEKFLEIKGIRYLLRCHVNQENLREGFLCYAEIAPYKQRSSHSLSRWHSINDLPVPWEVAKEAIAVDAATRVAKAQEKRQKEEAVMVDSLREINQQLFHGAY